MNYSGLFYQQFVDPENEMEIFVGLFLLMKIEVLNQALPVPSSLIRGY